MANLESALNGPEIQRFFNVGSENILILICQIWSTCLKSETAKTPNTGHRIRESSWGWFVRTFTLLQGRFLEQYPVVTGYGS